MRAPTLGRIYVRLAGERHVKGLAGFRGRRLVKARALLPRRLQPPLVLVGDGLRLVVSSDPLDVRIVRAMTGTHRHVFFPPALGDLDAVRLVLEVGAHHGIYTAVAARAYPRARIIAVEPALDALRALRRQVRENDLAERVEIVPAAIAERAGVAVLSHEDSGSWGATLHAPEAVTATESVVTLPLAALLGGRSPDVVKCNGEGAEFEVVRQLEELSIRPAVMVLAVHPDYGDVDELRARLERAGYGVVQTLPGDHPVWLCTLDDEPGSRSDR